MVNWLLFALQAPTSHKLIKSISSKYTTQTTQSTESELVFPLEATFYAATLSWACAQFKISSQPSFWLLPFSAKVSDRKRRKRAEEERGLLSLVVLYCRLWREKPQKVLKIIIDPILKNTGRFTS